MIQRVDRRKRSYAAAMKWQIPVFVGAALLLASCSGSKSAAPAGTTDATGSTSTSRSSAPTVRSSSPAALVVAHLHAAHLPIASIFTVTAANDDNHLLGRPNGYTSKQAWVDTRIDLSDVLDNTTGAVDRGGSVEAYPDASGAKARMAYIQGILKAAPALGTEYDYVVANTLVRVSSQLTPTQAAKYQAAAPG